jgi:hypothetical protein
MAKTTLDDQVHAEIVKTLMWSNTGVDANGEILNSCFSSWTMVGVQERQEIASF